MLGVEGRKCEKHMISLSKKRKTKHISLFISKNIKKNRKEKELNSTIRASVYVHSSPRQEIILSSELPTVPFYMPKMISRTPSPFRNSRFKGKNLRFNIYNPGQISGFVDTKNKSNETARKKKIILASSFNQPAKVQQIEDSKRTHSTDTKIKLNELGVRLPNIINMKKRKNSEVTEY